MENYQKKENITFEMIQGIISPDSHRILHKQLQNIVAENGDAIYPRLQARCSVKCFAKKVYLWYKRIPIRKLAPRCISHTHVTSVATMPASGRGVSNLAILIIKLPNHLKFYVYAHMHVRGTYLHMNMPERVHDGGNTGGQNLQILKCDR